MGTNCVKVPTLYGYHLSVGTYRLAMGSAKREEVKAGSDKSEVCHARGWPIVFGCARVTFCSNLIEEFSGKVHAQPQTRSHRFY